MGHDIYAKDPAGNEIAYLHRNAASPLARAIYKALGAEHHDGEVSGYGSSDRYDLVSLTRAVCFLEQNENALLASTDAPNLSQILAGVAPAAAPVLPTRTLAPERAFLLKCLYTLRHTHHDYIEIRFT